MYFYSTQHHCGLNDLYRETRTSYFYRNSATFIGCDLVIEVDEALLVKSIYNVGGNVRDNGF